MLKKVCFYLVLLSVLFSCVEENPVSPPVQDDQQEDSNSDEVTKEEDPNYHLQGTGKSAKDLLTADNFNSLNVEVVYVEGYEPKSSTLDNLKAFLQERLNKPEGIIISKTAIPSPGLAPYSIADIQQVESNFRKQFNKDKALTVFAFVTDGDYAENENVLGVAYRNTSVALFGSKIDYYSGGLSQPSQSLLETTVLNHEFGHILGLVNVGTPLQSDHQDTAHGKHCEVEGCLMYWTAETGDVVSNLVGLSKAPSLDAQCIADLQAMGGK